MGGIQCIRVDVVTRCRVARLFMLLPVQLYNPFVFKLQYKNGGLWRNDDPSSRNHRTSNNKPRHNLAHHTFYEKAESRNFSIRPKIRVFIRSYNWVLLR